ncbi:hypothetical protein FGLOB1_13135 [Fusarium globosum]|uniref:Uncharacterized protein n=1 Tax=Fusarium globosum TaxID=78864 RepID=A0A8H5XP48_9HYPO|nr:hypothetical protein FGLOB1_13135 [Fusarium globosum]
MAIYYVNLAGEIRRVSALPNQPVQILETASARDMAYEKCKAVPPDALSDDLLAPCDNCGSAMPAFTDLLVTSPLSMDMRPVLNSKEPRDKPFTPEWRSRPMEGPGDLDDSIRIDSKAFNTTLYCSPSFMAFSMQFLVCASNSSINTNGPIPRLSFIGSAPSSPHALKEAIRGGIDPPPELLETNAALRRERAHDIDLRNPAGTDRSRRRAEDPIGYKQRVTADKKSWSLKNPDKVLKIAAKVGEKNESTNRFVYGTCEEPFQTQAALDAHLNTEKHAKRAAGIHLAPLFTCARNLKNQRPIPLHSMQQAFP